MPKFKYIIAVVRSKMQQTLNLYWETELFYNSVIIRDYLFVFAKYI